MPHTSFLRAAAVAAAFCFLSTPAVAEDNAQNEVTIEGKMIPQDIVDDYNRFAESPVLDRRQVPGAHCRQDALLSVARSGSYWTAFCSSFVGAPTATYPTVVTPTS